MNKRKLLLVALSLCMVAILAIGGTLAYFTDTDAATNVFTVGNVDIELKENYIPNSTLVPTTGKDENGNVINAVEKDVWVENTGSEKAYVRLHIAIPAKLDDGYDTFDASSNLVHFNAPKDSYGNGKWNWGQTEASNNTVSAGGAMVPNKDWNFYTTNITENDRTIKYNVYVVTYETALEQNGKTAQAIYQIYLEQTATNADITEAKEVLGDNWQIKIVAQGVQSTGFDDAYAAFEAAYGNNELDRQVDFAPKENEEGTV